MMKLGKRGLKKRAEGLRLQILNHENKVRNEQAKQTPDEGKIHHWEAEIKAFKNSLARVLSSRKMKTAVCKETKTKILLDLLSEYEEECLNAVRLIEGLKLQTLTEEQTEDMLGELSASITHLRIHSEQLEKLIDGEL